LEFNVSELWASESEIVIATPGRLFRLCQDEIINVECVQTLVLDEADLLFGGDIYENEIAVLTDLPKWPKVSCLIWLLKYIFFRRFKFSVLLRSTRI
jgi:superfamily II DNA/RNA helicase